MLKIRKCHEESGNAIIPGRHGKNQAGADKRMIETIMKMEIEKIKLITTFVILLLLSIYRFEKS